MFFLLIIDRKRPTLAFLKSTTPIPWEYAGFKRVRQFEVHYELRTYFDTDIEPFQINVVGQKYS